MTEKRTLWLVAAVGAGLGLMFVLLGLSSPILADPGDVLVNRGGGATADQPGCGTASNPPCYSIAYAVSTVAQGGDRVLVAAGTYTEQITMKSGVVILGQSGPDLTFIDGESVRGPMVTANGSQVTSTARLESFTVKGGNPRGILISGASPVISDCTVFDNVATTEGGGIRVQQSTADPEILNSRVISNAAQDGGAGIGVANSASLTLVGSEVVSNTAGGHGGGLAGAGTGLIVVSKTLFLENEGNDGGGLRVNGCDLVLLGSEFYSNTAKTSGAAVALIGDVEFEIRDNVMEYNRAKQGCGIHIDDVDGGTIVSNTLQYNVATPNIGGAIVVDDTTVVISGNHIISNTVQQQGGGGILVTGYEADVDIVNNRIERNIGRHGAGLLLYRGTIDVISNTVAYNRSPADGSAGIEFGDSATVVISGNQIYSNTAVQSSGGGILGNSSPSFEIQDNTIAHNAATYGTAMSILDSSGEIYANTIEHNTMRSGGSGMAVYLRTDNPESIHFHHNWVMDNERGGLELNHTGVTVTNNIIAYNPDGSQVVVGRYAPLIANNTIVGNGDHSGIRIGGTGSPTITNNIVVSNAYGIRNEGNMTPALEYNDAWSNSVADYSGVGMGTGDISCDPDFLDLSAGDFHLGICSCAVDAGTNTDAPDDDHDRNARPVDGDGDGTATVDMGAYERLTVTAPLPVAGFAPLTTGMIVHFTNISSDATTYDWDFGDELGSSTEENPVYTYTLPGAYTVVLTATCAFDCLETYQDVVEPHLVPVPVWHKEIYVNGVLTDASPVAVYAGDTITVVDQVSIAWGGNVTYTLVETWSESLDMARWFTDVGSIVSGADSLTWEAVDVAADTWHTLTKTFGVLTGTWATDSITESLWVDGAEPQPTDRVLTFEHRHSDVVVSWDVYLPMVLRTYP